MDAGRQWQGTTDGASWMHRALIGMMKVFPIWIMYMFMSIAIPAYMAVNRKAFLSIYHYFRRRHGHGPLGAFWHSYLNHCTFGSIIIDRFGAYAGKKFRVDVPDLQIYEGLSSEPGGFLHVSSHIGCDEMAGYVIKAGKRINALVFGGEVETVTENRMKMFGSNNIRLVPIADDMSHLVALNNALSDGEIVNIHGDRVYGSSRTVGCNILGAEAHLPLGPFMLAAMREVPAVSVFVMRTGYKRYKALLHRLDEGLGGFGRHGRAEAMALAYAADIDRVLKEYPEQWFNFYEFWDD